MSSFISGIGQFISGIIDGLLNLLPDSPFQVLSVDSQIYTYLQYINWIIPFNFICSTFGAWLSCIAVYYVWSIALRWIKAID